MFRPQIQQTKVLLILAIINLLAVYISSQKTIIVNAVGYEQKKIAVKKVDEALEVIKVKRENDIDTLTGKSRLFYNDIDPDLTGFIYKQDSPITTGDGDLISKQTTLKPNFAAVIVGELIKANVSSGDTIAVGMTGSMPGANIALLAACEAMDVYPVIISSLGSSQYGATEEDYTWIDIEAHLYNHGLFKNKSTAYSPGGRGDCLRKGFKDNPKYIKYKDAVVEEVVVEEILPAALKSGNKARKFFSSKIDLVEFNDSKMDTIPYTNDIKNLPFSRSMRDSVFRSISNINNYAAYVNIGAGAASVGIGGRHILRVPGYLSSEKVLSFEPEKSMIKIFAEEGVPLVHILHIEKLVKGAVPFGPRTIAIDKDEVNSINDKLYDVMHDDDGDGNITYKKVEKNFSGAIFYQEKYDLIFNIIALLISLGSVIFIGIKSHNEIQKRMQSYEPDSII